MYSTLAKAVVENRLDVVKFLLDNDIDSIIYKEIFYFTICIDNLEMAKLFIKFCQVTDIISVSSEVIEAIENKENIINFAIANNMTALHIVESIPMAQLLLDYDARVDITDGRGKFPHETVGNFEVAEFLKKKYEELYPVIEVFPALCENKENIPWNQRFISESISIGDLTPVDCDLASGKFKIEFNDHKFDVSDRFINSLARKMKFSNNIFNYFSAEEVFERVHICNPEIRFRVTFDLQDNQILGVVDESKKILPPQIACQVFSEDPRIQSVKYENGIWKAEFELESHFNIRNDSEYMRKIWVHYPVDGVSMPCVYLAVLRQVCSNGAVALVPGFRTDIEINDEAGTHLSRLLRSYNNENGFLALESRLQKAQDTMASVNELLKIETLISNHISSQSSVSQLQTALNEVAGDPCARYETTSLRNINAKKRSLLPVGCSVNDLFNFCTELTSHHENLLGKVEPFYATMGKMMVEEFDLEEMYTNKRKAKDFHLEDVDLSTNITMESARRRNNTVLNYG